VSPAVNAELKARIARAAAGEFVRWDAEIFGRAGGKETIIIDASLMPVKDEVGKVVFIAAEAAISPKRKPTSEKLRGSGRSWRNWMF
jgi:adenylate cyclase